MLDLENIANYWSLSQPWQLQELTGGTNNSLWRVDTPSDGSYVLRVYRNHRDLRYMRFELAVMSALQRFKLSFQVPAPVPGVSGETLVTIPTEEGEVLAVLMTLIPGEKPDRENPQHVFAMGRACAELQQAMAQIHIETTDKVAPMPSFSVFTQWHPLIPDPLATIKNLNVSPKMKNDLTELVEDVINFIQTDFVHLPSQIIHSDFSVGNILMVDNKVTGVLDFEFCNLDARAMDLVTLLQWSSVFLWDSGREWEIIDAIGKGYTSLQPLTEAEKKAIPQMMRLLLAVGSTHRLGRVLQGLDPDSDTAERLANLLYRTNWLQNHSNELIARAQNW